MISKLDPKYLMCDFNFEAVGAVIVPFNTENTVVVTGNFRSHRDLIGVTWSAEDMWSHPNFKYPTSYDFSDVVLSYDYEIVSGVAPMNSVQGSPTLTIEMTTGQEYHVRLWNYVVNRPLDNWEIGGGVVFPRNRIPGNATGTSGHIVIDFNNLYAGWREYDDTFIDGLYTWIPSSSWIKIDPQNIKTLKWGFNRSDYQPNNATPLDTSYPFEVIFTNWVVSGNTYLAEDHQPLNSHFFRLADGYDDNYSVTPKRYIEQFVDLGFRNIINIYIGASHFYDKESDGTPTPGEYEPYRYVIKTEPVINAAFEAWWNDFLKWAKYYGFKDIVSSVSLEMVNAPPEWWQMNCNGVPGTSGWTPHPHFVSFCNDDFINYYKSYVKKLADMQVNAGFTPFIQLGEPWWWTQDNAPCFYDNATREKHLNELGYNIPEWNDTWIDFSAYEDTVYWLQSKNGLFLHTLRDYVRSFYPNAKIAVLFFPPSVLDEERISPMIQIVNFPQEYWKNIDSKLNLDVFQVEDYDYLIFNEMNKHSIIYDFAWQYLQYQSHRTHYFAGFYPSEDILYYYQGIVKEGLWERITNAAIDGLNKEIESFIWAGATIRRDGWLPPLMRWRSAYASNINIL